MKKEFWKDWKEKTEIEEKAIKTLLEGKKIILENIPKEEIVSIYVKGSFPRREMNKKSDVDFVAIVKNNKYLTKLKTLEKKYSKAFPIEIAIRGYSLWEIKTGKRVKNKQSHLSPSKFMKHISYHKLLLGKDLTKEKFFEKKDKEELIDLALTIKNLFLKKHFEGLPEFGFSQLIKQVFWLTENEQRALGKNPPHSWKELAKSIKDKNHIVHDTLRFRLHPTKDKIERKRYISKLKKYLDKLEKQYDKH